jgi:nucleoside-diphosphate-sugar epimerase
VSRILVTGGGGFLGSAIVEALARRGDEVVALDIAVGQRLAVLAEGYSNLRAVVGELTEWPHLAALMRECRPDAVVHCAAIVGVPASLGAPMATMRVNVEGALNLFEAMRLFGVGRVVHISTEEVYGPFRADLIDETHPCNPVMPYGISKFAVERLGHSYARLYGFDCVNVRTCWVYGPGLPRPRVPKNLVDAAVAGRPLHLSSGAEFRVDHTYVDDLVDGVIAALDKHRHDFDVYHVASGTAPPLAEVVEVIRDLVPGADISVGPGEYRFDERAVAVRKGALDVRRAREHLNYQPKYDIRTGLAAYIQACRAGRS